MRITSKGQVTIPQEIRQRFGLLADTEVEFLVEGRVVRLVKAKGEAGRRRGRNVARVLRGSASVKMTTDEILALTRGR